MEQENKLKKKIIKAGIVFIGIVFIFTIVSKTIYIFLLPEVTTVSVSSGRVETSIMTTGKVGYDPLMITAKKVAVKTDLEGIVTKCYVEEGKAVKKGEVLFEVTGSVDKKELKQQEQQKIEVDINKGGYQRELDKYKEQLAEVQDELQAKQEEIAKNEKSYEMISLESQVAEKKQTVDYNEELYKEGVLAQNDYLKAKEELTLLIKQIEALAKKEKKQEKDDLKILNDKVAELKGKIKDNEEKLKLENNKLLTQMQTESQKMITSPIEGIVYEVDAAVGASVISHDTLLVILPKGIPVTLSFSVAENNVDKIKIGQEVDWTLEKQNYKAMVMKKTYNEKEETTTITCSVDKDLAASMIKDYKTYRSVDVSFVDKSDVYDVIVPNSAITSIGMNKCIYTIEEVNTTFERKYIVHENNITVIKEGETTSAIKGLTANSTVQIVSSKSKGLSDGAEVRKNK